MTTTATITCPSCDTDTDATRIRRDYTEDGVVEVWEGDCAEHGLFRETL